MNTGLLGQDCPNEAIFLHLETYGTGDPWDMVFLSDASEVHTFRVSIGSPRVCGFSSKFFLETQDRVARSSFIAALYTQTWIILFNIY